MPSQPPHSHPTSIPIPGRWRMGSANRPHRLLLGVLSSTSPAPPSPPQRREDGICCSPSFLLRHLAMLPWDQHFAPRFPLSFPAGFPVFSLSLWQDPAFSLPFHPKSSWKTPGRAPTFRLHPKPAAHPGPHCRAPVPPCPNPRAWRSHPLRAPQGTGIPGGHPGIQVPLLHLLPAGTMCGSRCRRCPGEGVALSLPHLSSSAGMRINPQDSSSVNPSLAAEPNPHPGDPEWGFVREWGNSGSREGKIGVFRVFLA